MSGRKQPLVEVSNLKKYFPIKSGMMNKTLLKAVDNVSFSIDEGETLGLVGESGCGKTTVGRTLLHLYTPTSGEVYFDGKRVTEKNIGDFRKDMQIVFQDPYSSLNPRMTVSDIIGEPLDIHKLYSSRQERADRISELLTIVGLNSEHANRYAHEFSGGQRQRVGIARALILRPELVICDEPISALDVSIQAQVVNMLRHFQEDLNLTYLFIAHDLSMVRYVSDDVGVMYLGQLVEKCAADEIYAHPLHPYTVGLLSSIPVPNPRLAKEKDGSGLEGDLPSPIDPPSGCRFHTRCPFATERCREEAPAWQEAAPGHFVACHRING